MEEILKELEDKIIELNRTIKQLKIIHFYDLKAMNNHLTDLETIKYEIKKKLGIN